jgi:ribonuclease D
MTAPPLSNPIWVDRQVALNRMTADLRRYPVLAVDTESNSLFAYKERVCLIQFSTSESDYLVDPLVLSDLSQLSPIFADHAIEKVFHAAEYDILCLKRDYGFHFDNIFDTMIAGRLLGRKEVGLGSMLQAEFGVTLDKRYQRANWGRRPMPAALLAYARLDTHYLIGLRNRLQAALAASGLILLAAEDFNHLCRVKPSVAEVEEGDNFWRISGSQALIPQQAAVLRELWLWRDRQAQAMNLPLFKVMANSLLLEIARSCPKHEDELANIPGMGTGLAVRFGDGILISVQRGLNTRPITYRNHNPRPNDAFLKRLENLREWRKSTAQRLEVESDVVLPRELMEQIATLNPQSLSELGVIMKCFPWRFDHYGTEIMAQINP